MTHSCSHDKHPVRSVQLWCAHVRWYVFVRAQLITTVELWIISVWRMDYILAQHLGFIVYLSCIWRLLRLCKIGVNSLKSQALICNQLIVYIYCMMEILFVTFTTILQTKIWLRPVSLKTLVFQTSVDNVQVFKYCSKLKLVNRQWRTFLSERSVTTYNSAKYAKR